MEFIGRVTLLRCLSKLEGLERRGGSQELQQLLFFLIDLMSSLAGKKASHPGLMLFVITGVQWDDLACFGHKLSLWKEWFVSHNPQHHERLGEKDAQDNAEVIKTIAKTPVKTTVQHKGNKPTSVCVGQLQATLSHFREVCWRSEFFFPLLQLRIFPIFLHFRSTNRKVTLPLTGECSFFSPKPVS